MNNIILVSHASNLNGAERCFIETIQALQIAFPEIKIFCVFPKDGALIGLCKPFIDGFKIIDLPWWITGKNKLTLGEKFRNLRRIFYSVNELIKYFRQVKTDLVISNTMVIVTPSIAARVLGVTHVWYVHELGKEDHGYSFFFGEYITKKIIGLFSRLILVNSWFVYSRYKNVINNRKLKTIYQPVEIHNNRVQHIKKTSDLVLIMVGRFAPGKGQYEAIDALKELINQGEEMSLLLVGAIKDEYDQRIKEYIKENDLDSKISIIDFTSNPEVYYERADIALICSKNEAFGRITIEAMKYGLPIIASNAGANTELINDGFNGLYYEPGSSHDLAEKILVLKDIRLRKKIGKNALKWANEKFNLEQYAEDLGNSILAILQ